MISEEKFLKNFQKLEESEKIYRRVNSFTRASCSKFELLQRILSAALKWSVENLEVEWAT